MSDEERVIVLYLDVEDQSVGVFGYVGVISEKPTTIGISGTRPTVNGLEKESSSMYVKVEEIMDACMVFNKDKLYEHINKLIEVWSSTASLKTIVFSKRGYKQYITTTKVKTLSDPVDDISRGSIQAKYNRLLLGGKTYSVVEDSKTRWKPKISIPSSIVVPNIVVNISNSEDSNIYFGFKSPKDIDPGLKSSKIALVATKTGEIPIIGDIARLRREQSDHSPLFSIDTRSLSSVEVLKSYERFGPAIFRLDSRKPPRTVSVADLVVGYDLYPPKLSITLIEKSVALEQWMDMYNKMKNNEEYYSPYNVEYLDITDRVMEYIGPNDKEVRLDKKKTLIYGVELPTRNNMKKLLEPKKGNTNSKVYCVTETMSTVRKRHIVIDTGKDVVIWCNFNNFTIAI